jgi:hypothetical protein
MEVIYMPFENFQVWYAAAAIGAVFGLFLAWDAIRGDDLDDALERTSSRFWALLFGAASATFGAAMNLLDPLLEVPGLVITAIGIGSIIAGINWEAFAAMSLIAFTFGKFWSMRG